MITAMFYVTSFLFALFMTVSFPKMERKINGFVDICFSYVTVTIVAAFLVFLANLIKVPVTQIVLGALFTVIGTTQLAVILVKRKVQKHQWSGGDFCAAAFLVLVVGVVMLYVFTPYLHFNYYNNVDPSNHFLYAQDINRDKIIRGMFYNSLYNGMFMQLFTWMLPKSWAYKAFIASDIYHLIVELLFFYGVMLLVLKRKEKRSWIACGLGLGYFFSYMLFSFLWGFIYWSMAAMLVQYLLVLLCCQNVESFSKKKLWLFVGLGFFSTTMCYIQFAPIVLGIVFSVVLYRLWHNHKLVIDGKKIGILLGVLIFIVILALIGYKLVFADTGVPLFEALKMGEQQNIGLEIILLIPVTILVMVSTWRSNQQLTEIQVAYIDSLLIQVVLTILSICHFLSTYYLQKSYIIIFFLALLVVLEGWGEVDKYNRGKLLLSYIGIIACLVISYAGDKSQTFSLQQSVLVQNAKIFSSYQFSDGVLSENSKIYLMKYVSEEFIGDKGITPLITYGGKGRGIGLWYDATYNNATFICVEDGSCTEEEMSQLLKERGATHFFVYFDDYLYTFDLHDYFDSFERVYQNEAGFVARFE